MIYLPIKNVETCFYMNHQITLSFLILTRTIMDKGLPCRIDGLLETSFRPSRRAFNWSNELTIAHAVRAPLWSHVSALFAVSFYRRAGVRILDPC